MSKRNRLFDPPKHIRAYWEALGQFVTRFSAVEVNLQCLLWRLAGTSDPMGKAVFSGYKVDATMGVIKRIAEVEKWESSKIEQMTDTFSQLAIINKLRNDLLHYGAVAHGADKFTVTNAAVAMTEDRIRATKITLTTFSELIADLTKIESFILVAGWGTFMKARVRESLSVHCLEPWQYKSPPQAQKPDKTQKTPRKRSPRPDSSQG